MHFQYVSKVKILATAFVAVFLLQACTDKISSVKVESDDEQVAYTLGYNFGKQIAANTDGLDINVIIAGLKEGFAEAEPRLTEEDMVAAMQGFTERRQQTIQKKSAELSSKNIKKGKDFLEANKSKEGVVTTESGLQYKVITEGEGDSPSAEDTVTVHYRGSLIDGTVFDSSVERGEPATFALNRVIEGWIEEI
jgi:FKBP-type peptidyl-prolyl cis-trans isomerase